MRIRKRKVPLPFSSLSPLPLSDPCFTRFLPPVQHLLANSLPSPPPSADSPPPDHPIDLDAPPGSAAPAPTSPALRLKQAAGGFDREKIVRDGDQAGRNDFRENCLVGAHVVARSLAASSSSSSSSFLDGKVFPLKKIPWGSSELMNLPGNKEYDQEVKDYVEQEDQKEGNSNITTTSSVKCAIRKRGRGGGLMEGSRCSRVNGRGWRCCQPTLVGYSLCEHHLGKGRLRSMTTVRVGATQKKDKHRPALADHHHQVGTLNGSHEEVDGFIITKLPRRRSSTMKLGMVKARSISSLLDETTATKQVVPDVPILSEEDKQEK